MKEAVAVETEKAALRTSVVASIRVATASALSDYFAWGLTLDTKSSTAKVGDYSTNIIVANIGTTYRSMSRSDGGLTRPSAAEVSSKAGLTTPPATHILAHPPRRALSPVCPTNAHIVGWSLHPYF